MKPIGPIPTGFQSIQGELGIGDVPVSQLVEQAGGTPLFVYSRSLISDRLTQLRTAFPARIGVNYAVKANPYPELISHMADLVDGFDIASGGELALLLDAGVQPQTISFAGPGKRDDELAAAIKAGVTLNCESLNEAKRTIAIAAELSLTANVAIRVNPEFELKGSGMKMGGGAKPFGVDADQVPRLAQSLLDSGVNFRGFHIFTGSQALNADAIIETQSNVLKLAAQLSKQINVPLPKLNMGGGFGIPYFPGDQPLDISKIGAALSAELRNLPFELRNCEFCLELGRYLVGEAGVYLTRVVDRKQSHGVNYLITDGGLHHQLAASGNFGTVVRRNYPLANATKFSEQPREILNVVGCLCTPLDRLGDQVHLPSSDVGDLIAVYCAGAYGASASPAAFLGQGPAKEIMI